jgi:short-subunit dehydrogenase
VRALTDLTFRFAESITRRRGGILNVASIAGFLPGPGMAVYYATKAFVLSFSEALNYELRSRDIRVTALCPGPVPTEFQARAGIKRHPSILDRPVEEVAQAGYDALIHGRRVVVPGWQNRLVTQMIRLAPRGLVLDLAARAQAYRHRTRLARGS